MTKKKVATLAGGVVLALAASYIAFGVGASILLRKELESIRAAGEPISFSELAPEEVPDNENAFLAFQKAVSAIKRGREDARRLPMELVRSGEDVKDEVELNSVAFELMTEAAKLTRSWIPIDYEDCPYPRYSFPYAGPGWRFLAVLNAARIQRLAEDGDTNRATSALEQGLALSEPLVNSPLRHHWSIALGCDEATLAALEAALHTVRLSPEQRARIARRLEKHGCWRDSFVRVMLGERCLDIAFFDWLATRQDVDVAHVLRPIWHQFLKLDQVCYLRLTKKSLTAARRGTALAPISKLPFYAHETKSRMKIQTLSSYIKRSVELDAKAAELRAQLESETQRLD